ncbi:MAG: hypothetical protein IKY02_05705 [Lachnospiraceae bacterium]|nr:hypothetical protein [Lachnospiraceae bacterium]MBR5739467.1 hypothetical protein [Lachnospiraceae bacterium]
MALTNQAYSIGYRYGTEAPKQDPERIRKAKKEYMKQAGEKVEARVKSMHRIRYGISVGQAVVVTVCVLVILIVAGFYLVSVSGLEARKTKIENLKKEIQVLKRENDQTALDIEHSIDYEGVYEYAVSQGMQVPSKQQIVYYRAKTAEYVSKRSDIPNE